VPHGRRARGGRGRMARGGHGRMARGGRGRTLPKAPPGPAMPYPSMPSGHATPETASRPSQECPRPQGGRAACSRLQPFWTPHAVRLCLAVRVTVARGVAESEIISRKVLGDFAMGLPNSMPCGWLPLSQPASREGDGRFEGPGLTLLLPRVSRRSLRLVPRRRCCCCCLRCVAPAPPLLFGGGLWRWVSKGG
jgi:hypothetical protein